MAQVGFGWDVAAWISGNSALAKATVTSDGISLEILDSKLTKRRINSTLARQHIDDDAGQIRTLIDVGPLAIDIPLDLQHLMNCLNGEVDQQTLCELSKRKVDQHYGGLSPLADKIGATVARLRTTILPTGLYTELGIRLFETYPKASLLESLGHAPKYKSGTSSEKSGKLNALLDELEWERSSDPTEDEFDACICAIAALDLEQPSCHDAPTGYVISRKLASNSNRRIRFEQMK